MCEGKPCVASVTIGPLTLTETTCAVSTLATPKSAGEGMGKWATVAIACQGVVDSDSNHCPTSAEVCSPYAKPPPSFRECIYHEGDVDCPSAYPNKSVFYSDVDDQRSCTPCACEAAQGSECTGDVTLNETNTCAETPLTLSAPLDTSSSQCYPLHTGMALASKSATIITYSPGACAPTGGEVTGTVTPTGPSTFCCLTAP